MLLTKEQRNIIREAQEISISALNNKGEQITSSELAKELITASLLGRENEVFAVMALDNNLRVISYDILFTGTVDKAAVYPREIIKYLLERNASRCIVAHNHPALSNVPSQADVDFTRRLAAACELFEIELVDHIVVGTQANSMVDLDLM